MRAKAKAGHNPCARQRRHDRVDVVLDDACTDGIERTSRRSGRRRLGHRLAAVHPLRRPAAASAEVAEPDVADGVALVEKQGLGNGPAVLFRADQVLDRKHHVVKELFAVVTDQTARGAGSFDGHPGRAPQRDRDHRQAAMLRHVPVAATEAEPEVRLVSPAAPHLGAAEDVDVAVPREARHRGCHVRPTLWLRQQLHPERVAPEQWGEELGLGRLRAVVEDRRGEHPDRHPVRRRNLAVEPGRLVVEGPLVLQRQAGTAEGLGERYASEPVIEQEALQLAGLHQSRVPRRQVGIDPGARSQTEVIDGLVGGLGHMSSSVLANCCNSS